MIKFKVPCSSANLGIGFDTLGIAFNIYDTFEVCFSDEFILEGFINDNDLDNNLFINSYKKACLVNNEIVKPIKVILQANIPSSRGLGSSSALIVGGIFAYKLLYNSKMTDKDMLDLSVSIEGHPDNVAPAIYGGMCVNHNDITLKKEVSKKWHFSLFIPDYEVKTSIARSVLKNEYKRNDCVNNISASIIAIDALENYSEDNIKVIMDDRIHEPYRKQLIKDFESIKKIAIDNGALAFIISGSGSTMLAISNKELNINIPNIIFKNVQVDYEGVKCLKN